MKKSLTALICGIIGSLICMGWAFACGFFGNVISAASNGTVGITANILGWLAFLGSILALVGASISMKNAMPAGAICLSVGAILCAVLHIYLLTLMLSNAKGFEFSMIVILVIPIILLVVASIFAWLAKEDKTRQSMGPVPQNFVAPQEPIAQKPQATKVAEKTLEQELTELKSMQEKGLLTEEEFTEAKKSVLKKYGN